jgi:hypothetical protein
MKNSFYTLFVMVFVFSLTACSFCDTSSKNTTALTTSRYTVSFDTAETSAGGLALNKTLAEKQASLGAEHFAVVIVDLAGNVLERLSLNDSDIQKNTDGTWVVTLPGKQRTDRLIVVDLFKPVALSVASSIHQHGLVFTPTSDTHVNLTAGTTFAYKHFIEALGGTGHFANVSAEPVDAKAMNTVENLVVNNP